MLNCASILVRFDGSKRSVFVFAEHDFIFLDCYFSISSLLLAGEGKPAAANLSVNIDFPNRSAERKTNTRKTVGGIYEKQHATKSQSNQQLLFSIERVE
jgi:hypothetical protein